MTTISFNYKFNSLDDSHPKSENIEGLNIALMNHQKTAIYHAELLEKNEGFRINCEPSSFYLGRCREEEIEPYRDVCFNFGILACKVGSGKSFVALGLILKKKILTFDRVASDERNPLCFSFKRVSTDKNTVSTNIILVPHNLFNQWKGYIQKNTNMKTIFIATKKDVEKIKEKMELYSKIMKVKFQYYDSDSSEEGKKEEQFTEEKRIEAENIFKELTENTLYLISCNSWNSFASLWKDNINKKISRIFIDEVHSLNLPNSTSINTNFIWFITSSINDLSNHRNNGFIRGVIEDFRCLSKRYQEYIVVKNKDDYVDSSLQLPMPIFRTIISKESLILNIFAGVISQEVKSMLLAEDIQGVVSHLGMETVSEGDIIKVLCSNLEKELENAKMLHQTKEKMHYASDSYKQEALAKSKDKINIIKDKIDNVRQRISDSNFDPILHVEIVNPVITPCCKNKFELESITSYCEFNAHRGDKNIFCPMCRSILDLSKLIYVGEKKKKPQKIISNEWIFEDHTKIENLEYILNEQIPKDKKILIFSEHEGNFETISAAFSKTGRTNLSPLKGSMAHITCLIEKYNSGEIPNLFLNAKYCGSGLNLEKTDYIIMMHKMSSQDNVKQIIGRGNRIGRTSALNVIFLYTNHESVI